MGLPAKRIRFDQAREPVRRLGKPARWLLPDNIARQYFNALNEAVNLMIELTRKILIPALPNIVAQAKAMRPDHQDQYPDEIETLIGDIRLKYLDIYTPEKTKAVATNAAGGINAFNENQFQKVMKSVLNVDVFISQPWLRDSMQTFVKENVALIDDVARTYLSQVETTVFRGVRAGKRHEEIAKDITGRLEKVKGEKARKRLRGRFQSVKNRMKLIARDQTNKFNGQLTELRQTAAGIKKYIWQTAGDNRVRPEHVKRDGETFKWGDPPADGHPGEAVQCRCYAEPVITPQVGERFTGEKFRKAA